MKKNKPKNKVIKELATHFEAELNTKMPVSVRPDGSMVYKKYFIKLKKNGNWAIYNISNRDEIEEFFLKTCALMAAKAHDATAMEKFFEIKRLDCRYWSNFSDTLVYKQNIKTAKDFDRYLILLNRLEHSETLTEQYRDDISRMFKWTFV